MTYKAVIECDGCCNDEIELNSNHPADSENEYYKLTEKGWLIDHENYDYCPSCAAKVKAELEE